MSSLGFQWSAHAALIGRRKAPAFLKTQEVWPLFATRRSVAIERMREFVEHADAPNPVS
jgi:hypothetical protein